jgi:hypothetical protein
MCFIKSPIFLRRRRGKDSVHSKFELHHIETKMEADFKLASDVAIHTKEEPKAEVISQNTNKMGSINQITSSASSIFFRKRKNEETEDETELLDEDEQIAVIKELEQSNQKSNHFFRIMLF